MLRSEALCLEVINHKSENIFINTNYRQPSINKENFESNFGKFLKKTKTKITYLGDFSLNLLDYDTNLKVKPYFSIALSHNFLLIINKPMHVTNHNVTIIDHI